MDARDREVLIVSCIGLNVQMGILKDKLGVDLAIFGQKHTWQAFFVSVILFTTIAYVGLTIFGLSSSMFGVSDDVSKATDFEIETANRTGIEDNITNDTGWFRLSDHIGKVVIIDFMAHDCSNCHHVQSHVEEKMDDWNNLNSKYPLVIVGVGSWYSEGLDYLNSSDSEYTVPKYAVGLGGTESAIINETANERGDIRTSYNILSIPVIYVIDHEGYMVARESTGTPLDGWESFDSAVESALAGDAENLRFGLKEEDSSMAGVFFLGLMLSILVYFSPCAFPVLPGYISYYLSLGTREKELIEEGKLKGKMPSSFEIGILAGIGMWTFFLFIGILAAMMGEAFAQSGLIHHIALGVAILLLVLGFYMLVGGTAHLMGGIQKLIDKWSTTEDDEVFTPRRNMYLYGIGYAAASIDCTAAAVIPFVLYLSTLGTNSVTVGLGSLMLGLLVLMVLVTIMVGWGRQVMINFLKQATGMIKMVGSWMMMFAGAGLIIYITQPDLVGSLF